MRIAFCIGIATVSGLNVGSLLDFSYSTLEELRGNGELAGDLNYVSFKFLPAYRRGDQLPTDPSVTPPKPDFLLDENKRRGA